MGEHFGGEDCGNSFSGLRRSLSSPHTQNGVVQRSGFSSSEFEECDNGFSSLDRSSMGDDDQSMVEY